VNATDVFAKTGALFVASVVTGRMTAQSEPHDILPDRISVKLHRDSIPTPDPLLRPNTAPVPPAPPV